MNTYEYKFLLCRCTCSYNTESLQSFLNFIKCNCRNYTCWRQTPALMPQFKPHTFIPLMALGFHFEGKILPFLFVKEIHSLHFLDHFQNILNEASEVMNLEALGVLDTLQVFRLQWNVLVNLRKRDRLRWSFENKHFRSFKGG